MGDRYDNEDAARERDAVNLRPLKRYVVTVTETVTVWAPSDEAAQNMGLDKLAWAGADTEDIDVEQVD